MLPFSGKTNFIVGGGNTSKHKEEALRPGVSNRVVGVRSILEDLVLSFGQRVGVVGAEDTGHFVRRPKIRVVPSLLLNPSSIKGCRCGL